MSNVADSPQSNIAPNGERVPAGPDAIPASEDHAHAIEHREIGHNMDTDEDGERPPSPAP